MDPAKFKSSGSTFFIIDNHSKIVLTDKLAYIGSANYSAESQGNYECGVLFSDPEVISNIREEIVDQLVEAALPNDMTPIAEARVLIRSLQKRLIELTRSLAEGLLMSMKGSEPELDSFKREAATVSTELLEQIDALIDDIENEIGEYGDHSQLLPVHELLAGLATRQHSRVGERGRAVSSPSDMESRRRAGRQPFVWLRRRARGS